VPRGGQWITGRQAVGVGLGFGIGLRFMQPQFKATEHGSARPLPAVDLLFCPFCPSVRASCLMMIDERLVSSLCTGAVQFCHTPEDRRDCMWRPRDKSHLPVFSVSQLCTLYRAFRWQLSRVRKTCFISLVKFDNTEHELGVQPRGRPRLISTI
jgi:hypothetical protein